MRDPKRIKPLIKKIEKIWKENPDLRLGQLISNAIEGISLYYVDDKVLSDKLTDMYEGKNTIGVTSGDKEVKLK